MRVVMLSINIYLYTLSFIDCVGTRFLFSLEKKSETEAKEIGGRSRKLLVAAGTVSSAYLRWHRRYRKHK